MNLAHLHPDQRMIQEFSTYVSQLIVTILLTGARDPSLWTQKEQQNGGRGDFGEEQQGVEAEKLNFFLGKRTRQRTPNQRGTTLSRPTQASSSSPSSS